MNISNCTISTGQCFGSKVLTYLPLGTFPLFELRNASYDHSELTLAEQVKMMNGHKTNKSTFALRLART